MTASRSFFLQFRDGRRDLGYDFEPLRVDPGRPEYIVVLYPITFGNNRFEAHGQHPQPFVRALIPNAFGAPFRRLHRCHFELRIRGLRCAHSDNYAGQQQLHSINTADAGNGYYAVGAIESCWFSIVIRLFRMIDNDHFYRTLDRLQPQSQLFLKGSEQ